MTTKSAWNLLISTISLMNPSIFGPGFCSFPIGKFNLLHDSPLNDLTDRPLVSQFVDSNNHVRNRRGLLWHLLPWTNQ